MQRATQTTVHNERTGRTMQQDYRAHARGWETQRQEHDYWIPGSDIEGEIPKEISGTFFRNGPGIQEIGGKKLAHPIDGDGLVCALTLSDGKAHFRSRFVQTREHQEEQKAQKLLYPGQMGTQSDPLASRVLRVSKSLALRKRIPFHYRDPSNTNVFYWGGKLLSCYETRLPHCLDPSTLDTLGPDDLNGALELGSMGAHFRIDPIRNRLIAFSLRPSLKKAPKLAILEFDPQWNLLKKQILPIDGLNYAHDFLITENYYIFHITPFVRINMSLALQIALGYTSPGKSMRYYADLPSRILLIPRSEKSRQPITSVDIDPCHIFHFATAHETEKGVEFTAVCLEKTFDMTFDQQLWLSNASVSPGKMYRFEIDARKKTSRRVCIDEASVEFPSTHPHRDGLKSRYVYTMASDTPGRNIPYTDIVKIDTQLKGRQVWNSSGSVGEPKFVPRLRASESAQAAEDDGFLLAQVYNPERHLTEFVILDATQLGKAPLARLRLKHHIPYGFHGTFSDSVFLPQ